MPGVLSTLFEQLVIKYKLRKLDFTILRFNTVSFGKHSLRYIRWAQWYRDLFVETRKKLPRCSLSNITLEKCILVCYQETIFAQTALFEVLNSIGLWLHLYKLCISSPIALPNFLFAHTEYSLS